MLRSIVGALACFVASVFGVATGQTTYTDDQCVGINAISPNCSTPEAAYSRDYFYIGGRYQLNAALDQNILVDQMYVEKLTPFGGAKKPYPIVLFTAGVPSGAVCAAHQFQACLEPNIIPGMAQHARQPSRLGLVLYQAALSGVHRRSNWHGQR